MASGRSLKHELTDLRSTMRSDGRTWRDIALLLQSRHHVNARVAFRVAHGWTQEAVARLYNESWPDESPKTLKHISYWENWEPGTASTTSARTPSYKDLDRLAQLYECSISDLLGGGDYSDRDVNASTPVAAVFTSDGPLPHDGSTDPSHTTREAPTKRRNLLGLGLIAVVSPEMMRRVLREAASEAMEFTRELGVSTVGSATFDHLEAVVWNLDRSYSTQPPAEQFAVARAYRARVEELIRGRHTLREGRRLYVFAAWLDEALAWLSHDLGDPLAAEAYAIDCYEHATEAEHDELCAWATDAMASIAMYTGRPEKTITAVEKGLLRVPLRHPLSVRLHAQAARAYARLGRRGEYEEHLTEAKALHEKLPTVSPMRFTVDTGTLADFALTAYPASADIWLGEFEQAKRHALEAVTIHETASPPSRSPSREAIARIDLGIALAELGAPDEAIGYGHQALASPRIVDSVRLRIRDLDSTIIAHYPDLTEAREFHDQCRRLTEGKR